MGLANIRAPVTAHDSKFKFELKLGNSPRKGPQEGIGSTTQAKRSPSILAPRTELTHPYR